MNRSVEVIDLEEKITSCTDKKGITKQCCECYGLIRNENATPYPLSSFQQGYLYALLNFGKIRLSQEYCSIDAEKEKEKQRKTERQGFSFSRLFSEYFGVPHD